MARRILLLIFAEGPVNKLKSVSNTPGLKPPTAKS
jgi:hypothetical protein